MRLRARGPCGGNLYALLTPGCEVVEHPHQIRRAALAGPQGLAKLHGLGDEAVHVIDVALHPLHQGLIRVPREHRQTQPQPRQWGAQVVGDPRQEHGAIGQQLTHLAVHGVELPRQAGQLPRTSLRQRVGIAPLGQLLGGQRQARKGVGDPARQDSGGDDHQQGRHPQDDHHGLQRARLDAVAREAHPDHPGPRIQPGPEPAPILHQVALHRNLVSLSLAEGRAQALHIGEVVVLQIGWGQAVVAQGQPVVAVEPGLEVTVHLRRQGHQGACAQHHQGRQVRRGARRHRDQCVVDYGVEGGQGKEPEGEEQGDDGPAKQGQGPMAPGGSHETALSGVASLAVTLGREHVALAPDGANEAGAFGVGFDLGA